MAPSKSELKDPQNTSRQTIIVLLGPTGSGKSTFIEVATCRAQNKTVGHSLQPHTKEIRAITVPHPSTDHPIVLVDTPGLDDTKFDAAIWSMIIVWLRKSYHVSTIAGIVYLYRISDNRSVGSPEKNMPLFDALCGDVKNNVVIATTMWKKVKQSDVGTRRENGWQELLQSGSRIMRFDDTFASAWEIIDNVVKTRIFNPTTSQAASLESRAKSDQLAGRIAELTRPRISSRRRAYIQVRRFFSTGYRYRAIPGGIHKNPASETDLFTDVQSENKHRLKRRRTCSNAELPSIRSSISFDETLSVPVNSEDLSEGQVVIILMGLSGSGKSSFINAVTGSNDCMVGHGLETCTRVPKVIKFGSPQRKNIDFAFVDTPAFNYNAKTDLEVLQTDAKRLGAFFGGKVKLAGILYFHRIPDYPTNEVRSDLTVFRELCKKQLLDKQSIDPLKQLEKDAYKNVIFVTTMWDQVDEERGSLFEKELMSKHWKRMIDLGATAARFDGSSAAAWNIIERCINV